jgi:alpha-L-fucosidase
MKKTIIFLVSFLWIIISVPAQKIGGGELNPGIFTNQKSIEKFQDLRFGLSIHWGPNVIAEKEISWSRGDITHKEVYDNFYKQFNPTKFNADEWVKLIQDFGMKYVIITTKHHDGFSMWHSEFSEYDIAATPFKRDVLRELSDACQKKGVVLGTYYSTLDWYHPDYQPYGHGGTGDLFPKQADTPNQDRYVIYMKNQLRELVTKYNTEIIQFDGDWDSTFTHRLGSDLYVYLRKLNDKILVNSRTDKGRYSAPRFPNKSGWRPEIYAGDFEERERITTNFNEVESHILGKTPYPWQAWVTVDKSQWSWKPNPTLLNYQEIIVDLLKTVGDNGNYLINIGPRPEGTFEPKIIENMTKVGAWVKQNAEAIYGTRGGDFVVEGKYTSTRKGNIIHLFVLDNSLENIELNTPLKILKASDSSKNTLKTNALNGKINLQIGKAKSNDFVRVFTLQVK